MKYALLALAATAATLSAQAAPITPEAAKAVVEASGATVNSEGSSGANAYVLDAHLPSKNLNFSVRLGDCTDAGTCSYAMTFATFQIEETDWESLLKRVNAYNDSYPLGRAFVLPGADGQPLAVGIDYVENISDEATFDDSDLTAFQTILSNFIDHWTAES